ncbi:MAG: hypothetical protein IFK94_00605 [Acidobacteria bacterium]|uniref:Uncharacterized protein n=1 Tax=Candidatus Polarisedimenticola svalbardensis TaxID=2886004 RepID=A0A8J7C207_9BACT|nr:hypothetical protein [Candidatus Polarisedimenticola svalbardensis]
MGRSLQTIGGILLVGAAWLFVAESFGWVPASVADAWGLKVLLAGAVCFGGGLFLTVATPFTRWLAGTRCVRCRQRIERGQTYCMDHLREALNEYRDQKNIGYQSR